MKKTLITLAALAMASVASAAITTNSYTAADFGTDKSNSNGSWKVLTLDTTLDYATNWTLSATFTIGSANYNGWGTPAFATGNDIFSGSGLQIYLANNKYPDDYADSSLAGEPTGEKALRSKWFNSEHNSGVMTGTKSGDILTLTYSYDKASDQLTIGYSLDRAGTIYHDNLSNDTWYKATGSVVKPAEISELSTGILGLDGWSIGSITTTYGVADPATGGGAIPEPATATLSLLALAGLAARRRRK